MKFTALRVIVVVLALGAIAQAVRLWLLPPTLPTTSAEYVRGYFLLDMLLGAMLIVQAIPLLYATAVKARVTRWAGRFSLAAGVFCILIAVSIAYRHIR